MKKTSTKKKNKLRRMATKKTTAKTIRIKKKVKVKSMLSMLAKASHKTKSKSSKKIIHDHPTVIRKTFEKVDLIPHPFTEQNDHPSKIDKSRKSVYEISGIGHGTFYKFHEAGIKTVEDFVNAGLKKVSEVLGWSERGGLATYLRGLALHQNRIIKIKPLKTVSENLIYLDIETSDLLGSVIWMIGIYISKSKEFIQLVADRNGDEKIIIKQCLEILSDHHGAQIISYSGSRFDERMLRNKFTEGRHKHSHLIFDDILIDLKASLAFPIPNYTLGEVGDFFGYRFTHPNMSGQEVASIYMRYSDNLRRFGGYEKLCTYNEDDVKSMLSLVEHLYQKSGTTPPEKKPMRNFSTEGLEGVAELL